MKNYLNHLKYLLIACFCTLTLSACNTEPGKINHTLKTEDFFSVCLNNVTYLIRSHNQTAYKGFMSVKLNTNSKVVICEPSKEQELTPEDFIFSCIDKVAYYIRAHKIKAYKGYMAPIYNTSSKIKTC